MNIDDIVKHKYSNRDAVIIDITEGVNKLILVKWLDSDNYQIALPPNDFKILESEK